MKCTLLMFCFCAVYIVHAELHYGAREFPRNLGASFRNFDSNSDLVAFASEPVSAAEPSAPTRRRTRPPPSAYGTRRPQGNVRRLPKEDYQYSLSWPMGMASAPPAQYSPSRLTPPRPLKRLKTKRPSKNKRLRFGERPQGPGFRYDIFNMHAPRLQPPRFQPPSFLPNFSFKPPPHMNFMNFAPHNPKYTLVEAPRNNFPYFPRYRHNHNQESFEDHRSVEVETEQVEQPEPQQVEVQEERPKTYQHTTEDISEETGIQQPSKQSLLLHDSSEEIILKEPSEDISKDVLPPPVSPARQQPTFILIDPAFDRTPNRPTLAKEAIKAPHFVRVEDLKAEEAEPQVFPDDLSAIPGKAGSDYPNMAAVPVAKFNCRDKYPGFYADPDMKCQVWHYCDVDGRMASFLCPNGTLYNQETFVCDWWYNVACTKSPEFYKMNDELYKVTTAKPVPDAAKLRPSYSHTAKVVVSPQATEGVKVVDRQQDANPVFATSHQVIPAKRPRKLKRRRRPQAKSQGVVITATYSGDDITPKDSTSHVSRRF